MHGCLATYTVQMARCDVRETAISKHADPVLYLKHICLTYPGRLLCVLRNKAHRQHLCGRLGLTLCMQMRAAHASVRIPYLHAQTQAPSSQCCIACIMSCSHAGLEHVATHVLNGVSHSQLPSTATAPFKPLIDTAGSCICIKLVSSRLCTTATGAQPICHRDCL